MMKSTADLPNAYQINMGEHSLKRVLGIESREFRPVILHENKLVAGENATKEITLNLDNDAHEDNSETIVKFINGAEIDITVTIDGREVEKYETCCLVDVRQEVKDGVTKLVFWSMPRVPVVI